VQTGAVDDTLLVQADGQFHHRLWDNTGLAVSETGKWTMSRYPDGDQAVEFTGISPVAARQAPHSSHPGIWLTRVSRGHAGRVTFMLNRDLNLVYTRSE
jgi:hypothetical protein